MKSIIAAAFLLVSISGYTLPQMQRVSISPGFMKGKDYLDLSATEKRIYAMGAINGMLVAPMLDAPKDKVAWLETCTNNMTDEQVAAIIMKYITDHPGEWHFALNVLSLNAMITTCPHSKGS